jgi:hypothetical protein
MSHRLKRPSGRCGRFLQRAIDPPERKDELIMAVRARAEELADADRDLVVDEPSKGALAISAVVLAAFEQLIPLFWDMRLERPEPQVFEMKVRRCFFRDFFARHDATLGDDRHVRVRCELDAGDRPSGQRAASRAHLAAVARRRGVPVRGPRDGRSPGPLHRHARAALHRRSGKLIG